MLDSEVLHCETNRDSVDGGRRLEDVDAIFQIVTLSPGERAVLQTTLSRNGLPLDGDVEFTLVGRGSLSASTAETGAIGVVRGMETTPPVASTGDDSGRTDGVAQIIVRSPCKTIRSTRIVSQFYSKLIRGKISNAENDRTPTMSTTTWNWNSPCRATVVDPQTKLPQVTAVFYTDAIQVDAETGGAGRGRTRSVEGSVLYWLKQVQSIAEGGAFPIDTAPSGSPRTATRDTSAFHNALDTAIEATGIHWQAVSGTIRWRT